jgi:hypothetical protein
MAKNELLEPDDDRKAKRKNDVAVFGGLKSIIRLEKMLKKAGKVEDAAAGAVMGIGKKGSFANWLKAQDMTAAGKSADDIAKETGWEQHPLDKGWRMEIPDNKAKFNYEKFMDLTNSENKFRPAREWRYERAKFFADEFAKRGYEVKPSLDKMGLTLDDIYEKIYTENLDQNAWLSSVLKKGDEKFGAEPPIAFEPTLPDIFEHPELYKYYPELGGIKLIRENNPLYAGGYEYGSKKLSLNPSLAEKKDDLLSTTIHEVQHAVSELEGFEPGFSPDAVSNKFISQMTDFFNNAPPESLSDSDFLAKMTDFFDDPKVYGYRKSVGEVDARNAEFRNRMRKVLSEQEMPSIIKTMGVHPKDQFLVNELFNGFK